MIIALLVAGIGSLLIGLLAIAFGVPVKEFSFGNTLILVGAIAACTGLVLLGLWMVVRTLNDIAQRLGPAIPARPRSGTARMPAAAGATRDPLPDHGFQPGGGPPAEEAGSTELSVTSIPPPWEDEAASRDRPAPEPVVEAAPAAKPRRNLLFSSTSRKERERAQAKAADAAAVELQPPLAPAQPAPEPAEAPPVTFDDAWPKSERGKTPDASPRRGPRAPSTFTETRNEELPQVTVLKSGVVDGMAYSLYSDGSIEAQMPEGMMRFASIDELRAHLDHRP